MNPDPGQDRLGHYGRCYYAGQDLAAQLTDLWAGLPVVGRVMLASVASSVFNQELDGFLQQRWGLSAEPLVSAAAGSGIVNAYAEPLRLGVDRWLAMVAARRLCVGPVCVVDCGTAVTVDRLDANGRHQGGLILPGLAMMIEALSAGADNLSAVASIGDPVIGDQGPSQPGGGFVVARLQLDTASAVSAGVLTTLVAAIDRIVSEADRTEGVATHVLTGGDGARLLPLLSGQWLNRPHLVLEGMAIKAEEME